MAVWRYPNGLTTEPRLGSDPYYGPRDPIYTPGGTTGSFHTGVDYIDFSPVRAIGPGTVIYRAWNSDYGYEVRIDHGSFVGRYAHLASFTVGRVGTIVSAGTPLGPMGSTGKARGVHLHLRFDRNGSHFDPRPLLRQLVSQSGGGSGGATPDPAESEEDDDMTTAILYVITEGGSGTEADYRAGKVYSPGGPLEHRTYKGQVFIQETPTGPLQWVEFSGRPPAYGQKHPTVTRTAAELRDKELTRFGHVPVVGGPVVYEGQAG